MTAFQGNVKKSTLLYGAVDAQFQSLIAEGNRLDILIEPVDRKEFERYQALCRSQLGSDEFENTMEQGRGMTLDEAIAFALEQVNE